MNRLLIVLALVAVGCNVDVDEPWELSHDRIIAVRATPPRILPGEQARIDLLLGYETLPVAVKSPDFANVVSPASMADAMAVDSSGWVVTAPSEERLAAARAELGLEAGAPVPLQIGVAAAWPYPVMSPDPAGFAATKTVWLGESRPNPELVDLMIGGAEAPPEGTEIVVPADGSEVRLFVEADDEKQNVNWLSSAGVMHDFDLHSAYLTVDVEDPQAGEMAVVLRDEFGGVTWRVWPVRAE